MAETGFNYDFVISYAGEDQQHAEALYKALTEGGAKVFYAPEYQVETWGENLYEYFATIYSNEALFCIPIVSKSYFQKQWTRHEWRSAQERALKEVKAAYILPVRVDDTVLPGLPTTTGYLDLRDKTIEEIAQIGLAKLHRHSKIGEVSPFQKSIIQMRDRYADAGGDEREKFAQQTARESSACDALIRQALDDVGMTCANLALNTTCLGHITVRRTTSSGIVSITYTQPGSRASVATTHRIETSPANVASGEFGVNVMNVQANLPKGVGKGVIYVAFGGTIVENVGGIGQNVWQNIRVSHLEGATPCADAPDFFFIQSPKDIPVQLTVNGALLELHSSVAIRNNSDDTFTLLVVEGLVTVLGTEVTTGNEVTIRTVNGVVSVGAVTQFTHEDIAGLQVLRLLPSNILHYRPTIPVIA